MSYITTEGFDSYVASAAADDLNLAWVTSQNADSQFEYETGRHGVGQCLKMLSGAISLSTPVALSNTVKFGFTFKIGDLPASAKSICEMVENSSYQCGVQLQSNGALTAVRFDISHQPTVLQSSSKILRLNTWYNVKISMTMQDSIPADSFIVLINDEEWLNVPATSDTNNGGSAANSLKLGDITAGYTRYYDDFIMFDPADPWPFDHRIDTIRPNEVGVTNQWLGSDADSVDNHLLVDDIVPDNDTTYVKSSTVSELDLYNLTSLPITPLEIYCVNPCSVMKKEDSGSRTTRAVIRTGGTNFEGDIHYPSAISWSREPSPTTLNPDTGIAWIEADIDALQSGIKIES